MLRPLVGRRVQGLFHSPVRGSFHLSLTVLVRYRFGLSGVFSLAGWAPPIHAEFLVLRATQDYTGLRLRFVYRAFTFSGAAFQRLPLRSLLAVSCSFYPEGAETPPVWALPRSLATTCGITVVFSSCGYLDVSVPRVRLPKGMTGRLPAGLPHSDIAGSRAICASPALFAAYHVLLRLREPRHPPSALFRFSSSWHFRAGLICLQLALLFRLLFIANMSKIFLCGE